MAGRFRTLRADEIECRVQSVREKGLSLLLYKTARTDADLLDETVGPDKWENDFKLVDGVLYGGIGVDYGAGMKWKWDAGTESNTEAEKGRASDAFKRAGFKHGIGRELYTAPFIWVPNDRCEIRKDQRGNFTCRDKFEVSKIEYKDGKIVGLEIKNGRLIAYTTKFENPAQAPQKPADRAEAPAKVAYPAREKPTESAPERVCAGCGAAISDKVWSYSKSRFGRPLCYSCQKSAT